MARLRAGDCRYVGKILRPTKSPSDAGREGKPEVVVKEWPFANVERRGSEMNVALQMVPMVTHILKGWRTEADVKAKDYIDWDGRRLNIEFADPHQEDDRVLMLVCVEQAQ